MSVATEALTITEVLAVMSALTSATRRGDLADYRAALEQARRYELAHLTIEDCWTDGAVEPWATPTFLWDESPVSTCELCGAAAGVACRPFCPGSDR